MNTTEPLKIEVGKLYRTRDGRKARIYATDGAPKAMAHGAIAGQNEWEINCWYKNGDWWSAGLSASDLIAPWIDKSVIDWSKLAAWHNYVSMDENGNWWIYESRPVIRNNQNWSPAKNDAHRLPPEYAPQWTGDWRESLIERP